MFFFTASSRISPKLQTIDKLDMFLKETGSSHFTLLYAVLKSVLKENKCNIISAS
jgi:uncharacterized membrane protein